MHQLRKGSQLRRKVQASGHVKMIGTRKAINYAGKLLLASCSMAIAIHWQANALAAASYVVVVSQN